MKNFREKFIQDAIARLEKEKLTDFEKEFFESIKNVYKQGWVLSTHQYNTLQDIYRRFK